MFSLKRSLLAVPAAALMAGGCATGYETARSESLDAGPTTVEVTNHNWSDMNIYLVVDGTRQRLGTVMSQNRGTFRIPSFVLAASGRVQLLADPIGSNRAYLSAPLILRVGQQVVWQLENSIQLSSLLIR
ncbi:MAG TPA: hypothetical protein VFZ69_14765 [Longimicrobiales bacterium]